MSFLRLPLLLMVISGFLASRERRLALGGQKNKDQPADSQAADLFFFLQDESLLVSSKDGRLSRDIWISRKAESKIFKPLALLDETLKVKGMEPDARIQANIEKFMASSVVDHIALSRITAADKDQVLHQFWDEPTTIGGALILPDSSKLHLVFVRGIERFKHGWHMINFIFTERKGPLPSVEEVSALLKSLTGLEFNSKFIASALHYFEFHSQARRQGFRIFDKDFESDQSEDSLVRMFEPVDPYAIISGYNLIREKIHAEMQVAVRFITCEDCDPFTANRVELLYRNSPRVDRIKLEGADEAGKPKLRIDKAKGDALELPESIVAEIVASLTNAKPADVHPEDVRAIKNYLEPNPRVFELSLKTLEHNPNPAQQKLVV